MLAEIDDMIYEEFEHEVMASKLYDSTYYYFEDKYKNHVQFYKYAIKMMKERPFVYKNLISNKLKRINDYINKDGFDPFHNTGEDYNQSPYYYILTRVMSRRARRRGRRCDGGAT
jgi:hypothetical protein